MRGDSVMPPMDVQSDSGSDMHTRKIKVGRGKHSYGRTIPGSHDGKRKNKRRGKSRK
jgi:hypothetical protein